MGRTGCRELNIKLYNRKRESHRALLRQRGLSQFYPAEEKRLENKQIIVYNALNLIQNIVKLFHAIVPVHVESVVALTRVVS